MGKRILLVMLLAAMAALLAGPGQALAADWVVDDDLQQCKNADFTSIQAAVVAAAPGDKIKVCPGTYNEVVTVAKPNLELKGASDPKRCDQPVAPDPTKDSIVQAMNAAGGIVNLLENGIRLERFTVQNNSLGTGILTSPAFSDYEVEKNLVQNNVFGLYFNASGASPSKAEKNCFRMNNLAGASSGNGIYSDQGLHNAVIGHNDFFQNQSSGIVLTGTAGIGSISDVEIEQNTSIQDGSLLAIFFSTGSEVNNNKARDNPGSAIFVGNDNVGLRIKHNDVEGSLRGVRTSTAFGGGPSTNLEISHNKIDKAGEDGISVTPNSLTSSVISHNNAKGNGRDGVRIDAGGNANNLIAHNHLKDNVEHDCHDDTVGPGTAGTANTWLKNKGQTENRPGLCKN